MPIEIPKIDDRNSYQQILTEALSRIPVHNPEWTNFNNDSDPGVTILQLFAFMYESLLYRSNLIPERNRLKFLTLLGIPMQAAAAAEGFVVINNEKGPLKTITLSKDLEVMAGKVPFRTLDSLDVLPVEAQIYYKSKLPPDRRKQVEEIYAQLYASHEEAGKLEFYETIPLESPTNSASIPTFDLGNKDIIIDGSLWIALLARPREDPDEARKAIANKILNIGIMPDYSATSKVLLPGGPVTTEGQATLYFEIATREFQAGTDILIPKYNRLKATMETDILTKPGVVKVTLPDAEGLKMWDITEPLEPGTGDFPPSLEDTKALERIITWIRVRLPEEKTGSGLSAKISWVGINATRVMQRAHISSEKLGPGTGEPDQSVTLVNTPVIPDTVKLTVNGEPWSITDDLMAAAPEVEQGLLSAVPEAKREAQLPNDVHLQVKQESKVFTVDRESGKIQFGDGARGKRPPNGAAIRVSYDYGGGRQGNVNIGEINKSPALPSGFTVINPLPTKGGDEPESVSEAERNIPRYLRHKDRLVTENDFKDIAQRTPGVDIGRVEAISLFNPNLPDDLSPGTITIMVIPRYDVAQPEAPIPDRLFLELVCKHLEPRRLVTTEVHVVGPKYKNIYVSVGIEVAAGWDFPPVREAVNNAIRDFLSPLKGGRDGKGWPLKKAVVAKELEAEATRVEGVAYVTQLLLGDEFGDDVDYVPLSGVELPRILKVDTQQGDPEPLEQLLGEATISLEDAAKRKQIVPVPVIPKECRG